MRSNFNDKSLIISYIEQMLYETYNGSVKVNGKYYETFDMNYGLAHFIAKYLDLMYPILDTSTKEEYANIQAGASRQISDSISVMNYFLCDNKGHRLSFDGDLDKFKNCNPYNKIYNQYMVPFTKNGITAPLYPLYFNKMDTPLFVNYNKENNSYSVNDNIIFELSPWTKEKNICEIDDYIGSYLLGRTIGPRSSMEDIYYAQKLLIRDRNIEEREKGIWCIEENTQYDMTQTVMNYQRQILYGTSVNNYHIYVTGYFDIFTEAYAVKEVGVRSNGILGL